MTDSIGAAMEYHEDLPNGERRQHRKLVRFDPTISMGSLMQLAVILVGFAMAYGTYRSDQTTRDMRLAALEKTAETQEKVIEAKEKANKDAMKEIKDDVKEIQKTLTSVDKTVSSIQAGMKK